MKFVKIKELTPLIHSETDYSKLVAFLDRLVDEVGDNEHHPLVALMETVGTLIEAYEEEHFPFSEGDPLEVLRYLMKEFNLTQKDMPELGSQGVECPTDKGSF